MVEGKKEIARDVNTLIASEKIYSNYRELVNAGFKPNEAILYLATLIGYITVNKRTKK